MFFRKKTCFSAKNTTTCLPPKTKKTYFTAKNGKYVSPPKNTLPPKKHFFTKTTKTRFLAKIIKTHFFAKNAKMQKTGNNKTQKLVFRKKKKEANL